MEPQRRRGAENHNNGPCASASLRFKMVCSVLSPRRCLIVDFGIGGYYGFGYLPNVGEECLDLMAALLKIGERSDTKIAEKLPVAGAEPSLNPRRRVMVEDLLAPGIGGNHPEYSLSV